MTRANSYFSATGATSSIPEVWTYVESHGIHLVSGASGELHTSFADTVRAGVPRTRYQEFTDLDLGELARVWGGVAES